MSGFSTKKIEREEHEKDRVQKRQKGKAVEC